MTTTQTPDPWPSPQVDLLKGKVVVLVPSRDRPKQLANLIHSVLNTTQTAEVIAYLDEDQRTLYQWTEHPPDRLKVIVGPRIGPVAAINAMVKLLPVDYAACGAVPDDATFTIPEWDQHVLSHSGQARLIAPAHRSADVDMPFVSRRWLEALGWFAWPGLYHWGWPSVLACLGAGLGKIHRARPSEFWIEHPAHESMNRDRYPSDMIALYDFFACHAEQAIADLKAAP